MTRLPSCAPRPARARAFILVLCCASLAGCARYSGSAVEADPERVAQEPGWVLAHDVPLVRQRGARDCGAAALSSVLAYWGQRASPGEISSGLANDVDRTGLTAGELERYARERGLAAFVFHGSLEDIAHELSNGRPVVVGVAKPYQKDKALSHFQVVTGYHPGKKRLLLMDPGEGWRQNSTVGFEKEWSPTGRVTLVVFRKPGEPAPDGGERTSRARDP